MTELRTYYENHLRWLKLMQLIDERVCYIMTETDKDGEVLLDDTGEITELIDKEINNESEKSNH